MQTDVMTAPLARVIIKSETAGILAALALGAAIICAVGFAGGSVVHAAAHDTRHSMAFPCH